ncbi:hypothetical protein GF412_02555 [Candidatus Micrarchaeota archaeon]|nr:hypothetical protein [Candidatus Micrarchaeota archaeon]MBD3417840.1 hypothetical protein [Candidatus Micrarchaeota archaeon]
MPRGRRIVINKKIDDDKVDSFRSLDMEELKGEREELEGQLSSSIENVMDSAKEMSSRKKLSDDALKKAGLYSIQEAYEFLRSKGLDISFRAFGGRIERRSIPSVKIGKKRYLPVQSLEDMLGISDNFYTVRKAYEVYKKHNKNINYRAFIGRVEKNSIPSLKIGTKRLIPKDAIDSLSHVAKKYYSVSEALKELHKRDVSIKRNAFERRLDRNRIPHVKISGRRFIPRDVVSELIDKELALRKGSY